MAESLEQIKSLKSQRLAYEAVATELSLVSEFILYTGDLKNFLNNLAKTVATDSAVASLNVKQLRQAVNQRVSTINNLNQEFLLKIKDFDSTF